MKKSNDLNPILEEMKSEVGVCSTVEMLRARRDFVLARLALNGSINFDKKETKVTGVSPARIQEIQEKFKNNRNRLVARISKGYEKSHNLKQEVVTHSRKSMNPLKDGGYNI